MEQELENRLKAIERKTDAIHISVEKTQKYFLWTIVASVVALFLPIVAAAIIIPLTVVPFLSAYGL